jgi:hypothetical protein
LTPNSVNSTGLPAGRQKVFAAEGAGIADALGAKGEPDEIAVVPSGSVPSSPGGIGRQRSNLKRPAVPTSPTACFHFLHQIIRTRKLKSRAPGKKENASRGGVFGLLGIQCQATFSSCRPSFFRSRNP